MTNLKYKSGFKILLFLVGLSIASCNSKNKSDTKANDETAEKVDADIVSLSDSQFTSSGMELGKITMRDFTTSVESNGMFDVPPEYKASVSAYFAGYVKNITLLPGESVKKGQVLFTLENPDYVQAQQDFLEAKGRLSYLKSDYERQKTLMADNVTSEKNFLKAESEYTVTLAQFQSLKKKLSLMNIDPNGLRGENLRSTINVLAPITGYVTSISVSKGMFLNPSDIALTIINTDHMHLEINIFENDLPLVKVGQPIRFKVQSESNSEYGAEVHLVNKSVNTANRTVSVHGHLKNEEDAKLFAPGMFVETRISTSTASLPALPQEAVANIDNDYLVLVKQSANTFRKQLVKVGATDRGYVQILNAQDFEPDTEFLTKGVFNLITE